MGMLFRNWLDEGFYEDDGYGDLTKLEDPIEIYRAKKSGSLYHHDGMGVSKVDKYDEIDLDGENC